MRKRINMVITVVLSLVFVLMVCSCSSKSTNDYSSDSDWVAEQNENNMDEQQLSDECDKVLAEGYDQKNNHYQLVANETEDYDGTQITMGVIKNNKWLVEMTEDFPFINEQGLIYDGPSGNFTGSIFDYENYTYKSFDYIGNGCFAYNSDGSIIYNSENGKYYAYYEEDKGLIHFDPRYITYNGENDNGEKTIILSYFTEDISPYDAKFVTLNLDTMKTNVIPINSGAEKENDSRAFAYSEGLFIIYKKLDENWGSQADYAGFYDLKGNKVIDLSKYKITTPPEGQPIEEENYFHFVDGKATLVVINDQQHKFKITIDKKGDVLKSVEYDI